MIVVCSQAGFNMTTEWMTLASQQHFLARTLLQLQSRADDRLQSEAARQGATELALRARCNLLKQIARFYQLDAQPVDSLATLAEVVDSEVPELVQLEALAGDAGSWWNHLDQLEQDQANPPKRKKTVSDDNIIAVSVDTGPDRSTEALSTSLNAMKQFMTTLTERHDEW